MNFVYFIIYTWHNTLDILNIPIYTDKPPTKTLLERYYSKRNKFTGKFRIWQNTHIMALLISNTSLQCYKKNFTVNSHFPLKMWKFSTTMFSHMQYWTSGFQLSIEHWHVVTMHSYLFVCMNEHSKDSFMKKRIFKI